jgi:hypothetical protein
VLKCFVQAVHVVFHDMKVDITNFEIRATREVEGHIVYVYSPGDIHPAVSEVLLLDPSKFRKLHFQL